MQEERIRIVGWVSAYFFSLFFIPSTYLSYGEIDRKSRIQPIGPKYFYLFELQHFTELSYGQSFHKEKYWQPKFLAYKNEPLWNVSEKIFELVSFDW